MYVPRGEKTCLRGFRQSVFQTYPFKSNIEILFVASQDRILFDMRITNALISLRECAGCSAP